MLISFFGLCILCDTSADTDSSCQPVFVRWPRVKLNQPPAVKGAFSLRTCRAACAQDEHPERAGQRQSCAAFNHRVGPTDFHNDCQLFDPAQAHRTDGLIEADDRFSFFWKYCLKSEFEVEMEVIACRRRLHVDPQTS